MVQLALEDDPLAVKLALDATGVGVFDYDATTGMQRFCNRCKAIWGLRLDEEPLPQRIEQLVHPDDRHVIAQIVNSLSADGPGEFSCEHRIIRPDGGLRWLEVHGRTVFEDTGGARRARRSLGIMIDITERKRIEEQLIASEAQYRAIFANAAVGIAQVGLEGHWLAVNDRLCAIVGYTRKELLARTFADITYPADLEADWTQARQLLAGERANYAMEKRFVRRDGSLVWVNLAVGLMRDLAGLPKYFVWVVEDTSVQREAQESLRASEEKYRSLFMNMTEEVHLWKLVRDQRGNIQTWQLVDVNPAALKAWGKTLAETQGKMADEIFPNATAHFMPVVQKIINEGAPHSYETYFPDLKQHLRLTSIPMGDYFVTAAADITSIKTAELALREADRQKDEFLAMLAHELRNPLAPISNATELLTRSVGSEPAAKAPLAMLSRQTKQLSRLVDDLLDVSRISQGRIELKETALEIGEVIDQAVDTVQALVREKRHRLFIMKPPYPIYVRGDLARLVQSLGNLLHNAAKYTDPGGEITIKATDSDAEIGIQVRDNGVGISADLLPHVFDMFVQSDRTLDRAQGGLGIGLAVAKRLVNMQKGYVEVHSDGPGQGSCFTIRLPRIPAPESEKPAEDPIRAPVRRILVVDDNADAADSLAMLLQLAGHQVHAVYSSRAALRAADELRPDVLLLDIGLPEMNGYELARRIRQNAENSVRLVALTGYGQPEDRERAKAAGFDHHLVKPVDVKAVERLLLD